MSGFKKFLVVLFTPLLSLLILALVVVVSLNFTVGQAETVKQWVNSAGIYPAASTMLVTQISKNTINVSGQQIKLDQPEIVSVLNSTLSPAFVQQSAETILDGSYAWIQGKTNTPEYAIDLVPIKNAVIDSIATAARSRLKTLPACTIRTMPTTLDVFAMTCQPPAAVSEAKILEVTKQLQASTEILPTTMITPDTTNLNIDKSEVSEPAQPSQPQKPWYQQAAELPKIYKWAQRGFWVMLGLVILLILGILLLARNVRGGIKVVASSLLTSGVLLSLVAGLSLLVNSQFALDFGTNEVAADLNRPVSKLIDIVAESVSKLQLWIGLGLVVVSVICLVILRVARPKAPVPVEPRV